MLYKIKQKFCQYFKHYFQIVRVNMFIPDLMFTSHCIKTVLWDLYQLYGKHEFGALVSV